MINKWIRAFTGFIVECNLFIALASVTYTVQAQVELGMKPQWHPYLFLIFFATLFEYNSSRFISLMRTRKLASSPEPDWVHRNTRLFYAVFFISVSGFAITCLLAKPEVLVALLPLGVLTLLYALPLYKKEKRIFRLREIPMLKIFMISFIWSSATVLLPMVHAGGPLNLGPIVALITEKFFFIFAITIPFDIRDMASDTKAGTRTLPLYFGETVAWRFANISLVIFVILCIANNRGHFLYALLLSTLITIICINHKRIRRFLYYHYLVLDGMILVQAILVLLAFQLSR